MIFYIYSLFFVLSFFTVDFKYNNQYKAYINFSVVILVLLYVVFFVAFRGDSAADYSTYVMYFDKTYNLYDFSFDSAPDIYMTEPLFLLFMSVIKVFSNDSFLFFSTAAILSIFIRTYVIYKSVAVDKFAIAMIIINGFFYINGDFIQLRWSLAASFLLLYYLCLYDNKYIRSLLFALVAIAIHNFTVFFCLLFLFVYIKNKHSFYLFVYLLVSVFVFILFRLDIINSYLSLIIPPEYNRVVNYTSNKNSIGLSYNNIIIFLVSSLCFLYFKVKNNVSDLNIKLYTLYVYLYVTLILTLNLPVVFGRVFYIYKFFEVILFFKILKGYKMLYFYVLINLALYLLNVSDLYHRDVLFSDYISVLF